MPFILCQIDFMPVFSREHTKKKKPISLCPPINGIKSEFMPDRHKIGRPTFVPVRHEIGPLLRRTGMCLGFFVPRDQFDMRACRE